MNIPKLIPIKDIPNYLPVSLPTVRSWVHYKKLPVVRLGRKVFIKEADLVRISNEGTQGAPWTRWGDRVEKPNE